MNIRNISVFKCLCVRFIYVFSNENDSKCERTVDSTSLAENKYMY